VYVWGVVVVKSKVAGPPFGLMAMACRVDLRNEGLHGAPEFMCDFELAESVGNDDYWGDDYWQKKGQEQFEYACKAYWRRLYGKLPGRHVLFYGVRS
jgi:hypothetical protein